MILPTLSQQQSCNLPFPVLLIWNNMENDPESGTTLLAAYMINSHPRTNGARGVIVFAAFFAEKSSEKVAYPVVLGEVLFLFLHLLQGVGHILHPTVVVLQSFLTGQISPSKAPFSTPRSPSKTNTCKDVVMQKCGVWVGFSMLLAGYLAKEVAAILREILTHFLCSNYWLQPIY